MAAYDYLCPTCNEVTEHVHTMGEAPRSVPCGCGETMYHVVGAGVQIAPSGLEAKGGEVRVLNAREKRWDKDMPAYKRMRHRGMQPKGIDGAALLEDQVDDQMGINHKALFDSGVSRNHVIESVQQVDELTESL